MLSRTTSSTLARRSYSRSTSSALRPCPSLLLRRGYRQFPVPGFRPIPSIDRKPERRPKRPPLSEGVDPRIQAELTAARESKQTFQIRKIKGDNPLEKNPIHFRPDIEYVVPKDNGGNTGHRRSARTGASQKLVKRVRSDSPTILKKLPLNNKPKPVLQSSQGSGITFSQSGHATFPWLESLSTAAETGREQLTQEINAFQKYMSLTKEEVLAAEKIMHQVQECLPPKYKPILIGSRYTGMASPLSDIDLHIPSLDTKKPSGVRGPSPTRPSALKARDRSFQEIAGFLKHSGHFDKILTIKARIPLITAIHRQTGLEVQLQGSRDDVDSTEYVKQYLAEFPTILALHTLLKTMLEMHGLNRVILGGLGSYSLFMMIVASLKLKQATCDRYDAGLQFLLFLKMYSKIDFARTGISVEPPGHFPKTKKDPSFQDDSDAEPHILGQMAISQIGSDPSLMCLQDPADPWNDLGKKTYCIQQIQSLIRRVTTKLDSNVKEWPTRQVDYALLEPLVGGNYSSFEKRRARLVRHLS